MFACHFYGFLHNEKCRCCVFGLCVQFTVLLLGVLCSSFAAATTTEPVGIGVAGQIHAIAFDPEDSSIIYVGGDQCGVYVTYNGGANWEPLNRGLVDPNGGRAFYVDDLLFVRDAGFDDNIIDDREGLYAATRGGIYFLASNSSEWVLKTDHERYSYYLKSNPSIDPPRAQPIEFSTLCYDSVNHAIYAGSGTARWHEKAEFYNDFFPSSKPESNPPGASQFIPYGGTDAAYYVSSGENHYPQYSLWTLDVDKLGAIPEYEWIPVIGTETMGNVRRIAFKQYDEDSFYVAMACQNGFYGYNSDAADWVLIEPTDKTGDFLTFWSGNYWDVQFGSGTTLYVLQRIPGDTPTTEYSSVCTYDINSGDWGVFALDDPIVGNPSVNWRTLLQSQQFELTNLTVIPGDGMVDDIVVVGERSNWVTGYGFSLVGYYLHNSNCTDQWVHILGVSGGSINNLTHYYYTHNGSYCNYTYEAFDPGDVGWQDSDFGYPTVPLTISPSNDDVMIAWLGGRPLRSLNAGQSWEQIYCSGSASGWASNGLNEMAVLSLDVTLDNRLVVGAGDFKAFIANDSNNESYCWLGRTIYSKDDVKFIGRNASVVKWRDDRVYAIVNIPADRGQEAGRRSFATLLRFNTLDTGSTYYEIGSNGVDDWHSNPIEAYYSGLEGLKAYWVTDFEFIDDGTMVLSVVYAEYDPVDNSHEYEHSDIWTFVHNEFDQWVFTERSTSSVYRPIVDICYIPNTDIIIAGAGSKGGFYNRGGIFEYNIVSRQFATIVDGFEPPGQNDLLEAACRDVSTVVTDKSGSVVYVGTWGLDGYKPNYQVEENKVPMGTVIRLAPPFEFGVVPDCTILANIPEAGGDVFDIGTNYYHTSDPDNLWPWTLTLEGAKRSTFVGAIAIDERDPRVIYVGLSPYPHLPSGGLWRYDGNISEVNQRWTHILGDDGAPNCGVTSIAIDRNNPNILYAGTSGGEELFKVTVNDVIPAGRACYTDRSEDAYGDLLVPGTGLKYSGKPYAMNTFDYDNDGDSDLLVTQRNDYAILYEYAGTPIEGVPGYDRVYEQTVFGATGYRGIAAADITNDHDAAHDGAGYVDLFLTHETQAKILQNTGNTIGQIFEDVSSNTSISTALQQSWCGSWGDYDRDGRVDLVVGRGEGSHQDPMGGQLPVYGQANSVLHNVTIGTDVIFEDVSSSMLTNAFDNQTSTSSVSWADVNNDGEIDLLVGDISQFESYDNHSSLYINNGNGSFTDDTAIKLNLSDNHWIGGMSFVDHNADGYQDLVVSSNNHSFIAINDGQGQFNQHLLINAYNTNDHSTILSFDYDLDTYPDYLCLPSKTGNKGAIFRSVPTSGGGANLINVTESSGLSFGDNVSAGIASDMTADGDSDLLIGDSTKYGAVFGKFYFQNTGLFGYEPPAKCWYGVRLIGDGGTNKSAIGASVSFTINGRILKKVVDGGNGLGGQSPAVLIFGVLQGTESATTPIATITWPDGYEQQKQLSRKEIVTVYDNSAPGAITNTLTATAIAHPDMLADWVIEWNTPYSSDPNLDRVTVTAPSTPPGCDFGNYILTPTSTGVTASVQPLVGGGYHHKIVWSNTLCVAGCSYDIQAESATKNQDGSLRVSPALGRRGSTHVSLNVTVCIEEPGIGMVEP